MLTPLSTNLSSAPVNTVSFNVSTASSRPTVGAPSSICTSFSISPGSTLHTSTSFTISPTVKVIVVSSFAGFMLESVSSKKGIKISSPSITTLSVRSFFVTVIAVVGSSQSFNVIIKSSSVNLPTL